jgi:hypothetical protein
MTTSERAGGVEISGRIVRWGHGHPTRCAQPNYAIFGGWQVRGRFRTRWRRLFGGSPALVRCLSKTQ